MGLMIAPSTVCIYGLSFCLFNGFADPRLHFPSIRRNKAAPAVKWWFCFSLLAHHVGAAFVVSQMMAPVIADPVLHLSSLKIPIILSCCCELFSWVTDLRVLMRTAPKWFGCAHMVAVVLQLGACLSIFLFVPTGIDSVALFCAAIGSASWLVAGFTGFTNSTHESIKICDAANSAAIGRQKSVARALHKALDLRLDPASLRVVEAIQAAQPEEPPSSAQVAKSWATKESGVSKKSVGIASLFSLDRFSNYPMQEDAECPDESNVPSASVSSLLAIAEDKLVIPQTIPKFESKV